MTVTASVLADDRDTLCGAHKKKGGTCGRPAGWGTDHVGVGRCKLHGGCTPTQRKHAHLKLAERGAAVELAEAGYEPVTDPVATLADVAGQARALLAIFASKVDALGDGIRYESEKGVEQLRAEMAIYERMLDRTAKFAGKLAELGFEERRLEMDEQDGRRLVEVLLAVIDAVFLLPGVNVKAEVQKRIRHDELPRLVQHAIETTAQ
jgi:hypothetical protein